MQPSAGNERTPQDVLQLKDMNRLALTVIASRASEIAAVMINPLQCFHLNSSPPSDLVLQTNNRKVGANPGYSLLTTVFPLTHYLLLYYGCLVGASPNLTLTLTLTLTRSAPTLT